MPPDIYTATPQNQPGVSVEAPPLRLDIDDRLLVEIIDQHMKNNKARIDGELKIEQRAQDNEAFWLGNQVTKADLQPHQKYPYQDNIIWQDSEKRIEIASGRMPDIIVTPSGNSMQKREHARLVEKHLQIQFGSSKIKRLIKDGLRQHGIYFIAAIKCRWDENKGENGNYVFELVRPNRFGIDHTATISHDGFTIDNVDFFWELIEEPLALTIAKFPSKANELRSMMKRGLDPKSMVSKIKYHEVHFRWYTNDGQPIEAVCWKYQNLILDKQKTPYFDYDGYTKRVFDERDADLPEKAQHSKLGKYYRNHFDRPRKPYMLFSYQNLGRSPYDDTTAIEQTIPLQRAINKRGLQIQDIADNMKPRYAFNGALEKKEVEAITNNSEDHIYINTQDSIGNVMTAITGLQPSPVLYNDMIANRGQIDAKFATHGTTRGEVTGSGESGISKQITREGDLVTADDIVDIVVERIVYEMANWAVQMMKLFYEKPQFIRDIGPDGEMLEAELKRDTIDDGIAINVRANSVDKVTRRNDAFTLAKVKGIDPLSLAEDMEMPNPKERTKRLMMFLMGEQDGYARYMRETGLLEDSSSAAGTGGAPSESGGPGVGGRLPEEAPGGAAASPAGPGNPDGGGVPPPVDPAQMMAQGGQPPVSPEQMMQGGPAPAGPVEPSQAGAVPPAAPSGPAAFGQGEMNAQQAQLDLQQLMNGQPVQPQGPPGQDYIMVFMQFVQSGQLDQLPPQVQELVRSYIQQLQQFAEQPPAQPAPAAPAPQPQGVM